MIVTVDIKKCMNNKIININQLQINDLELDLEFKNLVQHDNEYLKLRSNLIKLKKEYDKFKTNYVYNIFNFLYSNNKKEQLENTLNELRFEIENNEKMLNTFIEKQLNLYLSDKKYIFNAKVIEKDILIYEYIKVGNNYGKKRT